MAVEMGDCCSYDCKHSIQHNTKRIPASPTLSTYDMTMSLC